MKRSILLSGLALLLAGLAGFPGGARGAPAVSLDKKDYPVFPDEDKGADPAVPAEKGGAGFGKIAASLGWTTNVDFDLIGDPRAVKGGEFITEMGDYPSNLRPTGPQSNTYFNSLNEGLMFEPLLSLHPDSLEFIPSLATHWKKSADGMAFSYRINPNARWADGSPVTSEDVVATYDLLMDETLADPMTRLAMEKFARPVADGKYLVTVPVAKKHWRNFLTISSASIFPAKVLKSFPNAGEWVKGYNTKFMMGSGPYEGRVEDQVEGTSMTVRRRQGYWGEKARANIGLNNFDRITHIVITDEALAFERFKKGELTGFLVNTARRWVSEMTPDKVPELKRNLMRKVKIFNESPDGFQGIAMNMNVAPYDDIRVRKALALLMDRKALLEKLMYNQYMPLRTYFPSSPYENPGNPRNDYDPRAALALLAEAGWKTRNNQGQIVNARGEPLNVRILYSTPAFEKHLTMYQETLKQAGVTATLELTRGDEHWQRVSEKKYEMALMAWSGMLFPEPELNYRSTLAKVPNNNNITGVADPRLDALLDAYGVLEIEQLPERTRILREIDGILANTYPYVLLWGAPYVRVIHWDCLGYPEAGLTRTGEWRNVYALWWFDPEKAKRLEEAKKSPSVTLPSAPTTLRFAVKGKDASPAE